MFRRDSALIQVRPHPTLLYNTQNGAPGENGKPGVELEGGFYRANTRWTNEYWWDGMRRGRAGRRSWRASRAPR